jgi:hypothetical protein
MRHQKFDKNYEIFEISSLRTQEISDYINPLSSMASLMEQANARQIAPDVSSLACQLHTGKHLNFC